MQINKFVNFVTESNYEGVFWSFQFCFDKKRRL